MRFVPWQSVADWRCNGCGQCCKLYTVVLNFQEWLRIVRNYGVEQTASSLNELYIKRRGNGSCAFLCNFSNTYFCGLQHMKPQACQLWPFKVLSQPILGCANEAQYRYNGNSLFVYADSICHGLRFGIPTWEFVNCTLKEFVEIAAGFRNQQRKTTRTLGLSNNAVRSFEALRHF